MRACGKRIAWIAALIIVALAWAPAGGGPVWRKAEPGYGWSLPRDLGAHPAYATEWWYVTGNLETRSDGAEPLAFQLTFFRIGLGPGDGAVSGSTFAARDLVMAHASIVDPAAGGHVFSETLWRAAPLLGGFGAEDDTLLAWCRAPAGTAGKRKLVRAGGGFRLEVRDDRKALAYDLVCTPTRDAVFHGDGGFSPKNADASAASLYFSYTRMRVEGTVERRGQPVPVVGTSWFDREIFSSTLAPHQVGWDWLSLQLDDGRDLMLYHLRAEDGKHDFALGTLVGVDGASTTLTAADWTWEPLDRWWSPDSGADYPVRWRLVVPAEALDLELEALIPDQENLSTRTGVHYWEGAVRARRRGDSATVGRGFVELTGYGEDSRPPL